MQRKPFMTTSTHKIETTDPTLLTRVLDSLDRSHARLADRMHTARNAVRGVFERGLDRIELAIDSVRERLDSVDHRAADGIIHAQGVLGAAIEKARHARSLPGHMTS
jgi:ATP/maltotriose-dependent transcriptional regulator MalT